MVDRYRFPVTHWIMMSLNSEYKTHVDEDVDFTMSFDTYDAKKQANIREIKARLENISTPYEACKMAYHKVARTWDSGGFPMANIYHAPTPQVVCERYCTVAYLVAM